MNVSGVNNSSNIIPCSTSSAPINATAAASCEASSVEGLEDTAKDSADIAAFYRSGKHFWEGSSVHSSNGCRDVGGKPVQSPNVYSCYSVHTVKLPSIVKCIMVVTVLPERDASLLRDIK